MGLKMPMKNLLVQPHNFRDVPFNPILGALETEKRYIQPVQNQMV